MQPTPYEYFGAMVAEYDSLIDRAIPVYPELLDHLAAYLPERATKVLELGCGTGNYTSVLAKRYPSAHICIADGSHEMLEATRFRLNLGDRLETRHTRFEDLEADGSFDVVTSCIALHHVEHKAPLFARLKSLVAPGGMLIFGDQMAGANERHSAINWGAMASFWEQPGNLSPAERQSLTDHARDHDFYESIGAHLKLVEAAGFLDVDCVWRKWMWGVVTGRVEDQR